MSYRITTLALIAAVAAACGCSDELNTLPISTIAASYGEAVTLVAKSAVPEIVLVGQRVETHGTSSYVVADLVLVNPLDVPVRYTGYRMDSWSKRPASGDISPLYGLKVQDKEGDPWRDSSMGWCGTGAGDMIVRPKEAGRFRAHIPSPMFAAQIEFACTWSVQGTTTTKLVSSPIIPSSKH